MRTAQAATIAHRGASAEAPENTLAAIARAVELGCDLVEVDVQRTRDGILVLMHDLDLARTTDVARVHPGRAPWRVGDFTYRELLGLDAGSWFSPAYAAERVPTLEQAADAVRGTAAGLLVEVKKPARHPGIERDVSSVLRRFPRLVADGRAVVQSFDHAAMRRFARIEPGVPVGLLGRPPVRRLRRLARWARYVNPSHRLASPAYVAAVQAAGLDCLVWTVDRPGDLERVLDLGVDGVITNRPDALALTLDRRLLPAA